MPLNILGVGVGKNFKHKQVLRNSSYETHRIVFDEGGGCGVGLGLGWGFGTAFGSHYRSSRLTFQGIELETTDKREEKVANMSKNTT